MGSNKPPSDADMLAVFNHYKIEGNPLRETAERFGIGTATVGRYVREVKEKGLHLSPGIQEAMSEMGLGANELQGGWLKAKGASLRFKVPEVSPEDHAERIAEIFAGITPAKPVRPPETVMEDSLALLPDADVHLGMKVSKQQNNLYDYDNATAVERFKQWSTHTVMSIPPCHTALIVNAGDRNHANDDTDETFKSRHKLKVEGTHYSNTQLSVELSVFKIDLALTRHQNVIVENIGGNHDPNHPVSLSCALEQRYINEPRVTVIHSEADFRLHEWGDSFLAFQHGHTAKPKEAAGRLPALFPEAWGRCKYWHLFSAHCHDYMEETINSVRHHRLPSVCGIDRHAASLAFADSAGMLSMVFGKKGGRQSICMVGA
jgi:hypothetical protein